MWGPAIIVVHSGSVGCFSGSFVWFIGSVVFQWFISVSSGLVGCFRGVHSSGSFEWFVVVHLGVSDLFIRVTYWFSCVSEWFIWVFQSGSDGCFSGSILSQRLLCFSGSDVCFSGSFVSQRFRYKFQWFSCMLQWFIGVSL